MQDLCNKMNGLRLIVAHILVAGTPRPNIDFLLKYTSCYLVFLSIISITYGTTPWDDYQGCIIRPDLLIMIPDLL